MSNFSILPNDDKSSNHSDSAESSRALQDLSASLNGRSVARRHDISEFDHLDLLAAEAIENMSQLKPAAKIENWDKDFIATPTARRKLDFNLVDEYIPQQKNASELDTYLSKLKAEKFGLVKVPGDGNCFYHAIAKGIKRLKPDHELNGSDANILRQLTYMSILQTDNLKDLIFAMLAGDVWATLKDLTKEERYSGLHNLPLEMVNKLTTWHDEYITGDDALKDDVDNQVVQWLLSDGIGLYIEAIGSGNTFSGGVEAQVISNLLDLPIKIHKVEENSQVVYQEAGNFQADEEGKLHLLLSSQHYSLLLHQKQMNEKDEKKYVIDEKREQIQHIAASVLPIGFSLDVPERDASPKRKKAVTFDAPRSFDFSL